MQFSVNNRAGDTVTVTPSSPSNRRETEKLRLEKNRLAEALRESEKRVGLFFYMNPLPMYQVDFETLRFLDVNEAALRQYGYTRQEFLSMTAKDIRPPEEVERLRYILSKTGNSTSNCGIWKHRKKDGTLIDAEVSVNLIEIDGRKAVLALAIDATEKRLLEGQLRQAQKMEAIGKLAGGVAHDFNNMMMVVTSYAQLLLENKPAVRTRRYAEQILEAGRRASGVTRQLLAFSRKQVLQPTVIDLNELIQNLHKMLPRLLGEDIEMVLHLAPDLLKVMADGGQMEQVIINIAINARDAMPHGGKLLIETENAYLDETYCRQHLPVKPGHYTLMIISDNGLGMTAETKCQLFEPFFTTKELGKGTGLGLAMVYGIVKQSNGYVWVYSEIGRGTAFKIYLPIVAEPQVVFGVQTRQQLKESPCGTETILLVEDEAGLRAATREFLELKGYRVLEASSGSDAVRIARDQELPIDVIISDLIMPGMTGPEAVKEIKPKYTDAYVIYMSGYTDRMIGPEFMADGSAFIQKPFSLDTLAHKIAELLGQRSESLLK